MRFKWPHIKNCIPENWRRSISTDLTPFLDLCDFSPHINVKARIIKINKLSSSEIYKILITNISKPPTSQKFFNNKFDVAEKWKKVYLLPRFCTIDAYSRMFQYKILNNVLYLNEKLFHLHLVDSPLCLLCNGAIENIEHLFCDCPVTRNLWQCLKLLLLERMTLSDLTPQSAYIGFIDESPEFFNTTNHLLIIFKIFIYKYRSLNPSSNLLFAKIKNVVTIEKHMCKSMKQRDNFQKKWGAIYNIFQ